jgi:hypothetical protein
MAKIEGGTGNGKWAAVNDKNRLDVAAATFTESHLKAVEGETFIWTTSFSASTGNEILYIKNTSKVSFLVLECFHVGGVNAGLFEMYEVSGTAAGTSLTPKNTNLGDAGAADAVSFGEAAVTGLTLGDRIALARTPANSAREVNLNDVVILGLNDAVAIQYTGSTGIVDALVIGYYETIGDL